MYELILNMHRIFLYVGANFDSLWHFAKDIGWRLLFDFNVFLRNGTNGDPENAKKLLRYIVDRNYSINMDFELGNGIIFIDISLNS